jgi:hypothetical protein
MSKLFELGPLALAMLVLLVLAVTGYEVVKRHYRQTGNGNRRRMPLVIECPNKIQGLSSTLDSLDKSTAALRVLVVEQVKLLQHNRDGIDRLVDQHKPGPDGRENWKESARADAIREESRDLLKKLVGLIERNGKR